MSLQSSGNWKSGRWGESTMGRAEGGSSKSRNMPHVAEVGEQPRVSKQRKLCAGM